MTEAHDERTEETEERDATFTQELADQLRALLPPLTPEDLAKIAAEADR